MPAREAVGRWLLRMRGVGRWLEIVGIWVDVGELGGKDGKMVRYFLGMDEGIKEDENF